MNTNSGNKRFTIKDVVTVGALSVLAAILFMVGSMAVVLFGNYAMYAQMTVSSFLAGVVFVVIVKKVPKRGAVCFYGTVFSLVYALMGFWQMACILIPASVLAELILWGDGYSSNKRIVAAYAVQEGIGGLHGMIFFWVLGKAGIMQTFEGMFTAEDVEKMQQAFFSPWVAVAVFVLSAIFAALGAIVGLGIYKKFFSAEKAKAQLS